MSAINIELLSVLDSVIGTLFISGYFYVHKNLTSGVIDGNVRRLKFELLWSEDHPSQYVNTSLFFARAPVLGGWLVYQSWDKSMKPRAPYGSIACGGLGIGTGLAFIPDPEHKWNPEDCNK